MDIEAPSQVAFVGVPFCLLVSGLSSAPTVTVRGGGGVSVTPQATGYLICVVPNAGATTLDVHLESGSLIDGLSVIVRSSP